jgi:hypothetical protein
MAEGVKLGLDHLELQVDDIPSAYANATPSRLAGFLFLNQR